MGRGLVLPNIPQDSKVFHNSWVRERWEGWHALAKMLESKQGKNRSDCMKAGSTHSLSSIEFQEGTLSISKHS